MRDAVEVVTACTPNQSVVIAVDPWIWRSRSLVGRR